MKPIIQIVDDVMAQALEIGMGQSRVSSMYYGIFKPIINLHEKEGIVDYTPSIVENFRLKYERRMANKTISKSHMATVRRALQFLTSCADTGIVDFSYAKRSLKIIPSDRHMKLVNECMAGVTSGKGHRGGLSPFIRRFFCFIEATNPNYNTITDDMLHAFMLDISSKFPRSIGYIMQAVRILRKFLSEKNLFEGNTDFSVFTPKAPRKIMRAFYTEDEVAALLSATGDSSLGKRDKAMILLGYGNGLRAGDVVNLSKDNINWKSGELSLVQKKTSDSLRLTLNATTMNALADYILNGRPECNCDKIFVTSVKPHKPISSNRLSVMMTDLSRKAGVEIIPGRAFHGLRRSYAINLSATGSELSLVSQMLGHRSFNSDRQYLTFNREQTLFCALDFSMVPLTSDIYNVFTTGGDNHDLP